MMNAGMVVDHDTALQYAAIYRAVGYISSTLSMMPWRVMLQNGNRRDIMRTHPVDRLLHTRPNPEMSAFAFRETLISHALLWGNGYAEIERDGGNRPSALWTISPDRVEVTRDDDNNLVYEISETRGGKRMASPRDMFHLHGLGFDGTVGYSVVNLARRSMGVGMAAEQFGASFFQNGTVTNLKIEHPNHLGEQAYKNLKDSIKEWGGGPRNAFNPLIVEEGIKVGPLTMPMEDAQFLETRQFQVAEIARWFGLPPHKLQSLDKATFSNIEQQSIEVITDALQPWAVRLEQEADYKLFGRGAFYTRLNMNSLMRGDMEARANFYRELWNLGVYSVNDIREKEDLNPVPFGDKRFVQLNMTTLEKAGEEPVAPEPSMPEPDDDDTEAEEVSAKIARRERFRLQDAARRYAGDRERFIEWMFSFFSQHEEYCLKAFLDIQINASEAVAARTGDARLRMLEYFDAGTPYPEQQVAAEILAAVKGDHGQDHEKLPDIG